MDDNNIFKDLPISSRFMSKKQKDKYLKERDLKVKEYLKKHDIEKVPIGVVKGDIDLIPQTKAMKEAREKRNKSGVHRRGPGISFCKGEKENGDY
jgi:hypothetical protein